MLSRTGQPRSSTRGQTRVRRGERPRGKSALHRASKVQSEARVVEDFNLVEPELPQLGPRQVDQPRVDFDAVVHSVAAKDMRRQGGKVCTAAKGARGQRMGR